MRRLGVALIAVALLAGAGLTAAAPPVSASAPANPVFMYAVNDGVANSVSAYAVRPNGSLVEIPGSPFATGGVGDAAFLEGLALISASTAALVRVADRLYVANMGGSPATVSAFAINPRTGALRPLRGSPYALGFSDEFSLAMTPDGRYLFAAQSSGHNVETVPVNRDGTLDVRHRTNTALPIGTDGIAVSADGHWLALAGFADIKAAVPDVSVHVFAINERSGDLIPTRGSPVATRATTVAFGPSHHGEATLFTGTIDGTVEDFAVTPRGITKISSVAIGGTYPSLQSLAVARDGSMVYAAEPWAQSLYSFRVDHHGVLSLAAGPVVVGPARVLEGLAIAPDGKRLYFSMVGDDVGGAAAGSVGAVRLGAQGSMTASVPGLPLATGQLGWLRTIVMFEGASR